MKKLYTTLLLLSLAVTQSVAKHNKHILIEYHLKRGDTLPKVAERYNTTTLQIIRTNKLDRSKSINVGEVLRVPTNIYDDRQTVTHTKKNRGTLVDLTKNLHNVVKKIENINPTIIANLESVSRSDKQTKKTPLSKKVYTAAVEKKHKIKNLIKISSLSDKTIRFEKRAKGDKDKDIYESLSFGSSPLKLSAAKKQLGKRYIWGANGPKAFDCSGFTRYVCKQSGISIPRTSINQSKVGKRVTRDELKAGDLIFFDTSRRHRGYVNHVGIYIGHNRFIHASSAKKKVVIGSLNKSFYKSRFKWGSRVKS